MKICDRCHNRDGSIVLASSQIEIGPEIFHLSRQEQELIRDFILNPADWVHVTEEPRRIDNEAPSVPVKRKRGRPRKNPQELPTNPREVGNNPG